MELRSAQPSQKRPRRVVAASGLKRKEGPLSARELMIRSSPSMIRAEEIRKNLPLSSRSFAKYLLRSHVVSGFWLGLPVKFCSRHLSKYDKEVSLEVEGEETKHKVKYLAQKCGLSAQWRSFSISHKLVEGDACVFELIKPCKWKVHIVRASELTGAVDAGAFADEARASELAGSSSLSKEVNAAGRSLVNHNPKKRKLTVHDNKSEDEQSVPMPKSPLDFKDVKTLDEFKIQVDGLILDSEIPTHLRPKYYKLCCSQGRFLHDNLAKGLNGKLASGVITEVISIADAIQAAAECSAGLSDLERYDKTLKAFEDLGMVVGFMRARIDKLLRCSRELEEKIESNRNERNGLVDLIRGLKRRLSTVEKSRVKDLIRGLKTRLSTVEESMVKLDRLTETENSKFAFMQIAGEPW